MTYEEARSRRNFAKPVSFLMGEKFVVLVVPENERDYESYMVRLREHLNEMQDSDAIPFSSDGVFRLMAFSREEGRIFSSECEIMEY